MGVKAVIAPSFSDIFSGNAFKNGILTVALPQEAVDRLLEVAKTDAIHIDLDTQSVTTPFQDRFQFSIDPFRNHCLAEGWDEIGLTLEQDGIIAAYENGLAKDKSWLRPAPAERSEEHPSELQSLMRSSYAVICVTKKKLISRQEKDKN